MSEIETDRVRGCKRKRDRTEERGKGETKKRKKKEGRSCPDWYVCMYGIGMYWYGVGRYGTGVVWYGLFLFVLNS